MRRLIYSTQSQSDIAELMTYIAINSDRLDIARSFRDNIVLHCEKLARLPGTLGRARPELRDDIRSVPHGNYLIFFRYLDDVLEIVTVVNASRDLEAHFDDTADLP